jgi:hypothetical protein
MILLFALGFHFALCREISEHAKENRFNLGPWWNTRSSYKNKNTWHLKYLPFLPDSIGKLLFRKVLVWLTDAEHFFQFISLLAAIGAVFFGGSWQDALSFYIGAQVMGALKPLTGLL